MPTRIYWPWLAKKRGVKFSPTHNPKCDRCRDLGSKTCCAKPKGWASRRPSSAQANGAFSNSDLPNIKLRLVHSQAIDYDDTEGRALWSSLQDGRRSGAFSKVRGLRTEKRADVVVLIVDDASGCGLATRVAAGGEEAFAVVHHSCAALSYSLHTRSGISLGLAMTWVSIRTCPLSHMVTVTCTGPSGGTS